MIWCLFGAATLLALGALAALTYRPTWSDVPRPAALFRGCIAVSFLLAAAALAAVAVAVAAPAVGS
jgi:hypothetical protein